MAWLDSDHISAHTNEIQMDLYVISKRTIFTSVLFLPNASATLCLVPDVVPSPPQERESCVGNGGGRRGGADLRGSGHLAGQRLSQETDRTQLVTVLWYWGVVSVSVGLSSYFYWFWSRSGLG